jgi:hypothetical protein
MVGELLPPGRQECINDTIIPLNPVYVGFQETKKEKFSNTFLKKVLGNKNFIWNMLPSIGSAGGILVGVDADVLEVIS